MGSTVPAEVVADAASLDTSLRRAEALAKVRQLFLLSSALVRTTALITV